MQGFPPRSSVVFGFKCFEAVSLSRCLHLSFPGSFGISYSTAPVLLLDIYMYMHMHTACVTKTKKSDLKLPYVQ